MTRETKGARFLFTRTIQEILGSEDVYLLREPEELGVWLEGPKSKPTFAIYMHKNVVNVAGYGPTFLEALQDFHDCFDVQYTGLVKNLQGKPEHELTSDAWKLHKLLSEMVGAIFSIPLAAAKNVQEDLIYAQQDLLFTWQHQVFEALEDKNMSIKDLALALGRSQSTIRRWLDARGNPSVRDMASVTYVLDRKILVDKEIT